mgnify:CR=1 FL=1
MKVNCLLCGVGGQGIVMASKLLALAAMDKGLNVRTAETIGMAQRGGCVVSHVRISDEQIASSMISEGEADVILAFEPGEAVRCLKYLKSDGALATVREVVQPVGAALGCQAYDGEEMLSCLRKNVNRLLVADKREICELSGSPKVLNTALLAAAVYIGWLPISPEDLRLAVYGRIPEKYRESNLRAMEEARRIAGP